MEIILKEDNIIIRNQEVFNLFPYDYEKIKDCLIIIDEILNKRSYGRNKS